MIAVPDAGACILLDRLLGEIDPWYHLYGVDIWPDRATTIDQLTESDWSSYLPVRVNMWAPSLIVNGRAQTTADPVQWTRGATGDPQRVYGYYVTDGQVGPLLWAEHVCGRESIPMAADGNVVVVWPLITLAHLVGERCVQSAGIEVGGI